MKTRFTALVVSLGFTMIPAFAADEASKAATKLQGRDLTFLLQAAQDNILEIELGKIAQERGVSDAVKEFGAKMVEDHTKAKEALKTLAESKGVQLPAELASKHMGTAARLSAASGEDFDRAYLREMENEHKRDIKAFENASKNAKDADVKAFAEKTLPTLKAHLEHLQQHVKGAAKKGA